MQTVQYYFLKADKNRLIEKCQQRDCLITEASVIAFINEIKETSILFKPDRFFKIEYRVKPKIFIYHKGELPKTISWKEVIKYGVSPDMTTMSYLEDLLVEIILKRFNDKYK